MRRLSTIFAAAVLFVTCSAPAVDDALPGVPISQEHHHHLVLENSYVKAYEVELAPHEATLMHQHLHDYVYVVFGDDDITNAVAGKPEVKLKQPDLSVNFSPGPFAHVATNNGETPFRNITIELLHRQGEVKKFYPSIRAALDTAVAVADAVVQLSELSRRRRTNCLFTYLTSWRRPRPRAGLRVSRR